MLIQAVSEAHPVWLQEVLNAYHTNQKAQELLISLAVSSPDDKGYSLHKGIINYKHKVWISQNSALQTKLIAAMHSTTIGGHSGVKSTYQRLKRLFHWNGMKSDVDTFVQQCKIC
jgi:hypothetical protein